MKAAEFQIPKLFACIYLLTTDSVDNQRFQHAIALRDSGKLEEAICELRALRDSAPDLFEKAIIRINEFNCLLRLDKAGEAEEILADLRGSLEPLSPLRLDLDFCEIGLLMLRQQNEQGLKALDNIRASCEAVEDP